MTKIEELKAALEAATPGDWGFYPNAMMHSCECTYEVRGGTDTGCVFHDAPYYNRAPSRVDAAFITLAHNTMTQLLEVVERLDWITSFCQEHDEWLFETERFLEKLK